MTLTTDAFLSGGSKSPISPKKLPDPVAPEEPVKSEVKKIEPVQPKKKRILAAPVAEVKIKEAPKEVPKIVVVEQEELFDDRACTRPGYKFRRDGSVVIGSGVY